jgi:RNA polymerase sigma-70 factor (ECF subfamily)
MVIVMNATAPTRLDEFWRLSSRLFGLAYRMLGRVADAEDAVQEAYLRWHTAGDVDNAEAWLVSTTTRICIDRLRRASVERRAYPGHWLPEPIVSPADRPDAALELASNLSTAFMLLLERLSPDERAAFLLREVFDCDYATIARALGRSETACRQVVSRARSRVRTDRPRFAVDAAERRRLVERFMQAVMAEDEAAVAEILSPDVQMTSDGGGKAAAAINILTGPSRIARFFIGLQRKFADRQLVPVLVNGEPGLVAFSEGRRSAMAFDVDASGRISAIYVVTNPDKLTRLPVEASAG